MSHDLLTSLFSSRLQTVCGVCWAGGELFLLRKMTLWFTFRCDKHKCSQITEQGCWYSRHPSCCLQPYFCCIFSVCVFSLTVQLIKGHAVRTEQDCSCIADIYCCWAHKQFNPWITINLRSPSPPPGKLVNTDFWFSIQITKVAGTHLIARLQLKTAYELLKFHLAKTWKMSPRNRSLSKWCILICSSCIICNICDLIAYLKQRWRMKRQLSSHDRSSFSFTLLL